MSKKKLGEILRESNAISREQLDRALESQRSGERLGGTLLRLNLVDAEILANALAKQLGVDGVDLKQAPPTAAALRQLSAEEARRFGALPLGLEGEYLKIAMADPTDSAIVEEIARITGLRPQPYVATQSAIYQAIKHHYKAADTDKSKRLRELVTQLKDALAELDALLD